MIQSKRKSKKKRKKIKNNDNTKNIRVNLRTSNVYRVYLPLFLCTIVRIVVELCA